MNTCTSNTKVHGNVYNIIGRQIMCVYKKLFLYDRTNELINSYLMSIDDIITFWGMQCPI